MAAPDSPFGAVFFLCERNVLRLVQNGCTSP
jgi:hypothetical protein